jgi:hypothetical protein
MRFAKELGRPIDRHFAVRLRPAEFHDRPHIASGIRWRAQELATEEFGPHPLQRGMIKKSVVRGDKPVGDQVIQFVYASRATVPCDASFLTALLQSSRANNARLSVSGVLLYHSGSFLQVLEGKPETVTTLYTKIERDKRHNRIVLLHRQTVSDRSFPEWSMGLMKVDSQALKTIPGLNDFLTAGILSLADDSARLAKLLQDFRAGRWRQNIV